MRFLRWFTFPLSVLYWLIMSMRNGLFNLNLFKSQSVEIPVISVGNLSTGGTGKSPHCDCLLRMLQNNKPGLLSRGYGRKSKGFFWVEVDSKAEQVGDEPLMLKRRNPAFPVAVSENRFRGAAKMIQSSLKPIHCLLLDDALQHRWIRRDLDIVLSRWGKPFFSDHLLPLGNLRESRAGSNRAQLIIFTHCPLKISSDEIEFYRRSSQKYSKANVLFSRMHSDGIEWIKPPIKKRDYNCFLLIAGIAHPSSFEKSFKEIHPEAEYEILSFPDHHNFSQSDIRDIISAAGKFDAVISTEKDLIRLPVLAFEQENIPLGILKIEVEWLFEGEQKVHQHLQALFAS